MVRGTDLWLRTGVSPLWVTVRTSDLLPRDQLRAALAPLSLDGGPGVVHGDSTCRVPIRLMRGATKDEVVDDVIRQIQRVADLIDETPSLAREGAEASIDAQPSEG